MLVHTRALQINQELNRYPNFTTITNDEIVSDDPYYCGLRARVPNFVKTSKGRGKDSTASKRLSIAQLHHPASLASIHQLHQNHPAHILSPHQQQMLFHARSYESGIGMYRNFILEPFPNRYRNYLQDWYDNSMELPTRIYTDKHRQQSKLERHQQHLDIVTTNPNALTTNIIVTKNPLCVNYDNNRDVYGYCKPKCTSNYGMIVGKRLGSDSDIVYMDDGGRNCEEYFSDSLERYYEETTMSKLKHQPSFLYPFYQNHNYPTNDTCNYHRMYSYPGHIDSCYQDGYTLRRTASNESFFGVPTETSCRNVKSIYHKNHKHKKSKKYENRAQRNKTKLIRSSSDRSVSHVQCSDRYSTKYSVNNNSKYAKKFLNDDETETVYGYLKPRKHSLREH